MPVRVYQKTLENGTVVTVEDNGGSMVHLRVSKGSYHRSLALFREEAEALKDLLPSKEKPS